MPEWAARQLLHPEERRGREGKEGERGGRDGGEGEMPAGQPAEAGSRSRHEPPGPCSHPLQFPSPTEGVIA